MRLVMLALASWGLVFAPTVCRAEILSGCCDDVVPVRAAFGGERACTGADPDHKDSHSAGGPHDDERCHSGCCADARCDDGLRTVPSELTPCPIAVAATPDDSNRPAAFTIAAGGRAIGAPGLPFPPSDRPLLI